MQSTTTRIALLFVVLTVSATPSFGQFSGKFNLPKVQLNTGKTPNVKVAPSPQSRAPRTRPQARPQTRSPQTFRPQASKPNVSKPQFGNIGNRPSYKPPQSTKPRNFQDFNPGRVRPGQFAKPTPRPSYPGVNDWNNKLPGRVRVPGRVNPGQFGDVIRKPGSTHRPYPGQVIKPKFPGQVIQPSPGQIGRTPVPSVPGRVRVPGLTTQRPRTPGVKVPGVTVPGVAKPRVPGPKLTPGNVGDKLVDRIKTPGVRKPFPGFDKLGKDGPTKLDNVGKLDGLTKFAGLTDRLGDKLGKDKFKPLAPEKLRKNFGEIFKDGGVKKHAPHEFSEAKSLAILHLGLTPHCHWWADFLSDCHWHWHGCYWWDYCHVPDYWTCWTPCHYHVVYCPPTPTCVARSWYFGVECILVPDMAAYGIQEVYEGSPAEMSGLLPGDLIISVNQMGISDESVLANSIQTSNGVIELGIIRDGSEEPFYVDVAMELVETIVQ